MSTLLLPPDVVREQMIDAQMAETLAHVEEFNKALREIDPYLELVWVGEKADFPGLIPGRWHVVRRNPGAPDDYKPIVGPDDEYMDPHSGVFEQLARDDMWRGDAKERRYKLRCQEQAARQRQRDREAEDRRLEFAERLKALTNPGVSFAEAGKWKYRAAARRG
jgi:hypothetical protein